jgi:YHS domain-containing protein
MVGSKEARMTTKTRLMLLVSMSALLLVLAVSAQQKASDKAVDPVCGMSVDKASAKATFEYKGTTYYFCCPGCKDKFAKDPEKYLQKKQGDMKGPSMTPGEGCGKSCGGGCPMKKQPIK